MYDVVCFTSNKHLWAVQPFAWLFNKYWSSEQRVIIVGFGRPNLDWMPRNFFYYTVADEEYPADKWVDAAIGFLENYSSDYFVFTHEDYWLTRKVDTEAVNMMEHYLIHHPNVFRVDLTGDRLYAGGMKDVEYFERFDMIEALDSQYQMSHQACMIRTDMYLNLLKSLPPDKHSAWEVELEGTTYVNKHAYRMRVMGTRQWPIRYANALLKGKLDWNELPKLTIEDYNAVKGWIPSSYDMNGEKK